jgi:hypothetical protein
MMRTSTNTQPIHHLRRSVLLQQSMGATDGQLLEAFIAEQDELAFEALVRRHGPMVMGVCQRALGQHEDAEDAFQATFLVLVHKATSRNHGFSLPFSLCRRFSDTTTRE